MKSLASRKPLGGAPQAGRPVTATTRLFMLQLAAVLAIVGLPLVLLTDETDRFFAWTISPPVTAAFLGACYWGATAFVVACLRERAWASARVLFPGIATAGTLLLVATLIHLDRFHMDTARGWIWLVIYAALPPGLAFVLFLQSRAEGTDPAPLVPLPSWARTIFAVQAAVLLGLGGLLFVLAGEVASLWPWALTDLTARAVGAWLLTVGATLVAALREDDWARLRAPMIGYVAIAGLQLLVLARYAGTPDWGDPATWLYLLFLLGVLAMGLLGAAAGARARRLP